MAEVGTVESDQDRTSLVLYFICRNAELGISVSALDRKMAGLAFLFKLRGLGDVTKSFMVRQVLKGYRKGKRKEDSRRPVSFEVLELVLEKLKEIGLSRYEIVLFRAAFLLAFFGAFRISELVSPSKCKPGGLLQGDVACTGSSVQIRIRRSKTDQRGKGLQVELFAGTVSQICPVRAVEHFMAIRPTGGGAFLVHKDGSGLSKFQFTSIFRRCLERAGLSPGEYASHSFRIGAATEASRWGLPERAIQKIGRWESKRYRSYVRSHLI